MVQRLGRVREGAVTLLLRECFITQICGFNWTVKIEETVYLPRRYLSGMDPMLPARFSKKFLAIILDWFLSWAVAVLLTRKTWDRVQFQHLLVFFLEVAIFTILIGGSAGQIMLRLRVVDEHDGGRISAVRVLARTLLICLVVPAIFTKDGVGYHDIFLHTRVIKI
jgi:uncharacterized RDD family membrane protein YckC